MGRRSGNSSANLALMLQAINSVGTGLRNYQGWQQQQDLQKLKEDQLKADNEIRTRTANIQSVQALSNIYKIEDPKVRKAAAEMLMPSLGFSTDSPQAKNFIEMMGTKDTEFLQSLTGAMTEMGLGQGTMTAIGKYAEQDPAGAMTMLGKIMDRNAQNDIAQQKIDLQTQANDMMGKYRDATLELKRQGLDMREQQLKDKESSGGNISTLSDQVRLRDPESGQTITTMAQYRQKTGEIWFKDPMTGKLYGADAGGQISRLSGVPGAEAAAGGSAGGPSGPMGAPGAPTGAPGAAGPTGAPTAGMPPSAPGSAPATPSGPAATASAGAPGAQLEILEPGKTTSDQNKTAVNLSEAKGGDSDLNVFMSSKDGQEYMKGGLRQDIDKMLSFGNPETRMGSAGAGFGGAIGVILGGAAGKIAGRPLEGAVAGGYAGQQSGEGLGKLLGTVAPGWASDKGQEFWSAANTFLAGIGYQQTGAATAEHEFARAAFAFIPNPGEPARVSAQKAERRQAAVKAAEAGISGTKLLDSLKVPAFEQLPKEVQEATTKSIEMRGVSGSEASKTASGPDASVSLPVPPPAAPGAPPNTSVPEGVGGPSAGAAGGARTGAGGNVDAERQQALDAIKRGAPEAAVRQRFKQRTGQDL